MTRRSSIPNPLSAIRASAPGSLMLLGEHAVLHGRRALVCAIDRRITVGLSKTEKRILRLLSDLGTYEAPLDGLRDHPDFRFVLDAVRQYPLDHGVEIRVESEFSSDIGFGSSAAVTVAVHAALMQVSRGTATDGMGPFEREIFRRSLQTVRRVQGRGSGADVAASVFGGVVAYRAEPLEIIPLPESFSLTAVYSGSKMKTAEVIRIVEEQRRAAPEEYEALFDEIDGCTGEVLAGFSALGGCLHRNQELMERMGLCNESLAEIIRLFGAQGVPAKISGSGLGDCAIGLGGFPPSSRFTSYRLQAGGAGVQVGAV